MPEQDIFNADYDIDIIHFYDRPAQEELAAQLAEKVAKRGREVEAKKVAVAQVVGSFFGYLMKAQPWRSQANCRDLPPELFFAEPGEKGNLVESAKAVCRGCIVREECLEYALIHNEQFGVWGGLSPHERNDIRGIRGWKQQNKVREPEDDLTL